MKILSKLQILHIDIMWLKDSRILTESTHWGYIALLFLSSIFLSCPVTIDKQSFAVNEISKEYTVTVPENGFSAAVIDDEGNLWFGSNGGGIYQYKGNSFTIYTERNGLSSNQIFSIVADYKNNLWF